MLALIKAMAEKEKQPEPEPSPKKAKTETIFEVILNSSEVTDAISDSCLAEDPKSKAEPKAKKASNTKVHMEVQQCHLCGRVGTSKMFQWSACWLCESCYEDVVSEESES